MGVQRTRGSTGQMNGPRGPGLDGGATEVAKVETVSCDVAPAVPGTTTGGLNTHDVCGGRLPAAQLKVTGVLYGPFCGVTVTMCVLDWPA
jgi:hypothetical protein